MKKVLLSGFILFDLTMIGASGLFLFHHLQPASSSRVSAFSPGPARDAMTAGPAKTGTSLIDTPKPGVAQPAAPAGSSDASHHNIGFTYHNPHAKQVSIRADFTGWKAEPMVKAANGSWTYQATLTPGEYAYCFTADDKTFKDPANKRTKQIGRTLVSAILVGEQSAKTAK